MPWKWKGIGKKKTKDFVSSASPTHVLAWVLLCLHLEAAGVKAPRPPLPLLSAPCPSELRFPKLPKVSWSWFSLQGRCWLPGQPQNHSLLPQRARRMLADTQGSRGVTQESCWYFPLPEHHWFVKGTAFPGQILLPAVQKWRVLGLCCSPAAAAPGSSVPSCAARAWAGGRGWAAALGCNTRTFPAPLSFSSAESGRSVPFISALGCPGTSQAQNVLSPDPPRLPKWPRPGGAQVLLLPPLDLLGVQTGAF